MEEEEILDGKSIDPRIEKIDRLVSSTADKILEIATDRREHPSRLDIELVLKQFARDFGNLLLFGVICERDR